MLRRRLGVAGFTLAGLALAHPASADPLSQVSPERLRADVEKLVSFGTRSTFSEHAAECRGVVAARNWLVQQFTDIANTSGGRMTVAVDSHLHHADGKRVPRDVEIASVVATLKGDEPGTRTYVMSSHYDSRNTDDSDGTNDAPGADDNASGTAAVLEAARVLANVPLHATIIFAAYDSEEQGLFGSQHHAQALRAANIDVQGDLNNDIIGASVGDEGQHNPDSIRIFSEALPAGADPKRVNVIGNESDSPSRELARFVKEAGDRAVPGFHGDLIFRADRFLRGGDHESFNAAGYPAIRFTEPVETFAHQHQNVRVEGGVQYGDLIQFMDFNYLAQATRYNIAGLQALASAPGRPAEAFVLTHELTNKTSLTWSAVPGAARYEIVRRLTTDPTWTTTIDAGDTTSITVPFSKDEYIFGVRAVGIDGKASPAIYPSPKR